MYEIEIFFKQFNFSFEDFQLSKNKILEDIKYMKPNKNYNFNKLLWNYISDKITLTNEKEHYEIFNLEKEKKLL